MKMVLKVKDIHTVKILAHLNDYNCVALDIYNYLRELRKYYTNEIVYINKDGQVFNQHDSLYGNTSGKLTGYIDVDIISDALWDLIRDLIVETDEYEYESYAGADVELDAGEVKEFLKIQTYIDMLNAVDKIVTNLNKGYYPDEDYKHIDKINNLVAADDNFDATIVIRVEKIITELEHALSGVEI